MADIELIIKIDEKMYKDIQSRDWKNGAKWFSEEWIAIHNGTPLPKGHGRLIDADALEKRMLDREVELNDDKALWESSAVSVALDMFAPTIIEAYKENSYGRCRTSN